MAEGDRGRLAHRSSSRSGSSRWSRCSSRPSPSARRRWSAPATTCSAWPAGRSSSTSSPTRARAPCRPSSGPPSCGATSPTPAPPPTSASRRRWPTSPGMPHVIPVHQGRAAERILFAETVTHGQVVPNNTHFDTTRANIEYDGGEAVDLPCPEAGDTQVEAPFKGDMDVARLEELLEARAARRAHGVPHRHQQHRRRPARVDGQRPGRAGGVRPVRRAPLPRRRPLRRELLVRDLPGGRATPTGRRPRWPTSCSPTPTASP